MNRLLFTTAFLSIATLAINAQLKVTSTGKVYAGSSTPTTAATQSLDYNDGYDYSNYSFSLSAHNRNNTSYGIGLKGVSYRTTNWGRTIGVQGLAGGGSTGWNYGIVGDCLLQQVTVPAFSVH